MLHDPVKMVDEFCEIFKTTIRDAFPELDPHTTLGGEDTCFGTQRVTNAMIVCNTPLHLRIKREVGGGFYMFALSPVVDVEVEDDKIIVSCRMDVSSFLSVELPRRPFYRQPSKATISTDRMHVELDDGTIQSIDAIPKTLLADIGPKINTSLGDILAPKKDIFDMGGKKKAAERLAVYINDLRKLKTKENITMAFRRRAN